MRKFRMPPHMGLFGAGAGAFLVAGYALVALPALLLWYVVKIVARVVVILVVSFAAYKGVKIAHKYLKDYM